METKKAGLQDVRENILEYIRRNGPVLPVKLAKVIGSDITFAGAVLSELVANKKISVSKGRIGASPVYYYQGQEPKLQLLEGYLSGKEKEAFRLLKEKRVLRERDCEPAIRVALKEIKDFAMPLNVIAENEGNEVFWKWYLASDDEVKKIIAGMLNSEKMNVEKPVQQEVKPEPIAVARQEVLQDFIGSVSTGPLIGSTEKIIKQKIVRKKQEKIIGLDDLDNYLGKKGIEVLSREISKKGKQIDIIAYVPSELGKIKFFIAYRSKRKINDADVGLIFSKAQVKNIPAILLSNGELTKKAREYLDRDFRNITFFSI